MQVSLGSITVALILASQAAAISGSGKTCIRRGSSKHAACEALHKGGLLHLNLLGCSKIDISPKISNFKRDSAELCGIFGHAPAVGCSDTVAELTRRTETRDELCRSMSKAGLVNIKALGCGEETLHPMPDLTRRVALCSELGADGLSVNMLGCPTAFVQEVSPAKLRAACESLSESGLIGLAMLGCSSISDASTQSKHHRRSTQNSGMLVLHKNGCYCPTTSDQIEGMCSATSGGAGASSATVQDASSAQHPSSGSKDHSEHYHHKSTAESTSGSDQSGSSGTSSASEASGDSFSTSDDSSGDGSVGSDGTDAWNVSAQDAPSAQQTSSSSEDHSKHHHHKSTAESTSVSDQSGSSGFSSASESSGDTFASSDDSSGDGSVASDGGDDGSTSANGHHHHTSGGGSSGGSGATSEGSKAHHHHHHHHHHSSATGSTSKSSGDGTKADDHHSKSTGTNGSEGQQGHDGHPGSNGEGECQIAPAAACQTLSDAGLISLDLLNCFNLGLSPDMSIDKSLLGGGGAFSGGISLGGLLGNKPVKGATDGLSVGIKSTANGLLGNKGVKGLTNSLTGALGI